MTPQDYSTVIDSYGVIEPTSLVSLKSQVAGNIYRLSDQYYPGSFVTSGEILIQIDSEDYINST